MRMVSVVLAVTSISTACSKKECPEPGAPAAPAAKPPVAAADKPVSSVSVKNECMLGAGKVVVHVLMPIHYTSPSPSDSRQLYQLSCGTEDGQCNGVVLDLDHVDAGKPIDVMDLNRLDGARVVTSTGSVATVQWGPLRTFTIDLQGQRGVVRYVESGEGAIAGHTEGRGEAECETIDGRRCADDAGCLPSKRCSGGVCIPR